MSAKRTVAADSPVGSEVTSSVADIPLEKLAGTPVDIVKQNGEREIVYVGKLSIDQAVALAHVIRDNIRKLEDVIVAPEEGDTRSLYAQILDMALPLLDPDQMARFFSVLIDRESTWVRREVGLEDMAHIIEAVGQHNDFGVILRPLQRIVAAAQAAATPASAPSAKQPEPTATPEPTPSSPAPASANATSAPTPPTG